MIFLMELDYAGPVFIKGFVDTFIKDGILCPERLKQLRQAINHNIWVRFYEKEQTFGFDYLYSKKDYLYFFSKDNPIWGYMIGIDDRGKVYVSKIMNSNMRLKFPDEFNENGEDFINIKSLNLIDMIKTHKIKKYIQTSIDNCPADIK